MAKTCFVLIKNWRNKQLKEYLEESLFKQSCIVLKVDKKHGSNYFVLNDGKQDDIFHHFFAAGE